MHGSAGRRVPSGLVSDKVIEHASVSVHLWSRGERLAVATLIVFPVVRPAVIHEPV